MNNDVLLIARVAFWTLAALTVFLPLRFAVIAYMLLVQFDLSGAAFYSTDSLGIENALKVVVISSVLWLRVRRRGPIELGDGALRWTWVLLICYAGLSVLWSPFKLSAVKMLGYFYAYVVLFLVFARAWREQWINARSLGLAVWCSLAFACVQSYLLDNPYGTLGNFYGAPDFEFRFTSFTGAQSFAAFLLSLFAMLIFTQAWSPGVVLTALGAAAGILLTGSRSIFIGFAWILLFAGVIYAKRKGRVLTLSRLAKRMALGAAALVVAAVIVLQALPENRLNQMLTAVVSPDNSMQDVGTFVWRFTLYEKTVEALVTRSPQRLFVGSGTSSAAGLVLDTGIFTLENVDANRAIHDEFLRSLYEWGIPGLALLVAFLVLAFRSCLRRIRETDAPEAWLFLAMAVPILISLTVENFLADSASPGGVGYTLVLAALLASDKMAARNQASASTENSRWYWLILPRTSLGAN
jgi:O-antigen ligase